MGTEQFEKYTRLLNRFYKTHSELDLNNPDSWERMNENYKKFIGAAEPKYKSFVQRSVLGIMELLDEERKQNG